MVALKKAMDKVRKMAKFLPVVVVSFGSQKKMILKRKVSENGKKLKTHNTLHISNRKTPVILGDEITTVNDVILIGFLMPNGKASMGMGSLPIQYCIQVS